MASSALTKAESDLLFAIFKNVDSTGLDYKVLSAEVGCEQKQMAGRTFNLRKKVKTGNASALTANESILLAAVFKQLNSKKVDYAAISKDLGCTAKQMPGRMFNLRKKLGVNPKSGVAAAPGTPGAIAAIATRAGNKAAVRKANKVEGDVETPTKGRGRPRKAAPQVFEPESDVETDAKDEEMGGTLDQDTQGSSTQDYSEDLQDDPPQEHQGNHQEVAPKIEDNEEDYAEYDESSHSKDEQENAVQDQTVTQYAVQTPAPSYHGNGNASSYLAAQGRHTYDDEDEEKYYDANEDANEEA